MFGAPLTISTPRFPKADLDTQQQPQQPETTSWELALAETSPNIFLAAKDLRMAARGGSLLM